MNAKAGSCSVSPSSPRGCSACRVDATVRSLSPSPPPAPALEVFLAGHAATAGGSRAGKEVPGFPEMSWTGDEAKR